MFDIDGLQSYKMNHEDDTDNIYEEEEYDYNSNYNQNHF